jgi:hypothetical protein
VQFGGLDMLQVVFGVRSDLSGSQIGSQDAVRSMRRSRRNRTGCFAAAKSVQVSGLPKRSGGAREIPPVRLTPERSLVRTQYRPPFTPSDQRKHRDVFQLLIVRSSSVARPVAAEHSIPVARQSGSRVGALPDLGICTMPCDGPAP